MEVEDTEPEGQRQKRARDIARVMGGSLSDK